MKQCVPCSSIKRNCDLYLNEKFEIAPYKGDKLLSKNSEIINKCRHKRKFTILRHNSKDGLKVTFSLNISRSISTGSAFSPARLMSSIRWFSKQKSSSSKRRFHWGTSGGIFPVKTARKWRHSLVWILLHCKFSVIRYYLLTEDCRIAWNFKYLNLVFSFLNYVIVLLITPIYMVISDSFMNKGYIAKINSAPL